MAKGLASSIVPDPEGSTARRAPTPGAVGRLTLPVAGFLAGVFGVVAVACCGGRMACVLGADQAMLWKPAAVVNADEIANT